MKKRADGRYAKQVVIGYKPDGKQIRKTVYAKTQRELSEKAAELTHQRMTGELLINQKMTLKQAYDIWIEEKRVSVKPQSFKVIVSRTRELIDEYGHVLIKDINFAWAQELRSSMIDRPQIFNVWLSDLKSISTLCIQHRWMSFNPFNGLKRLPHKSKPKRALTPVETERIMTAQLRDQDRLLIDILYCTGCRISEVIALEASDFHWDDGYLSITKTMTSTGIQYETKTSAGMRMIPLAKALRKYRDKLPDGRLFNMSQASGIIKTKKILTSILGDTELTAHYFRHNFASMLYKAGVDPKASQYILGHADISTTLAIYTHIGFEDLPDIDLVVKRKSEPRRKVIEMAEIRHLQVINS